MSGRMRFETLQFGTIEASEDELVHFPGLPGFPAARRFLVRGHDRGGSFGWLLCVDDPALTFVVASPFRFRPDYAPAIPAQALRALGASDPGELEVLALATVSTGGVTLNLAAPILIHPGTRLAAQVILEEPGHPTRARVLDAARLPPASSMG
ncbi:MAG: flagellar assembly protein FliW [Deltaproteobacteria bacterium]|nr:flagellar assembly protein FliW [Deltaproteobacteria bacterium]